MCFPQSHVTPRFKNAPTSQGIFCKTPLARTQILKKPATKPENSGKRRFPYAEAEQQKTTTMKQKPATNPLEQTMDSFLAQAVATAELAAATCVGVNRAMNSPEIPHEHSPWHPFESREEWQAFDAGLDRCLEQRAAQQRSVA
jgi:hypothetical protein